MDSPSMVSAPKHAPAADSVTPTDGDVDAIDRAAPGGCPVAHDAPVCPFDGTLAGVPERSAWDLRMRRFFRLPVDAPSQSLAGANDAFAKSVWISASRCLLTYVLIPLLAPLLHLSGDLGPVLGIVLSVVSMVAIWFSARRFFAGDHRWRWGYFAVAVAIYGLLIAQTVIDVGNLLT